MTWAFWMWASASAGACFGFMLAGMLASAKHADADEERWLDDNREV